MNICSIITARGGSKGIERKNVKLLNNKPVISYTIEASLAVEMINDTYVTTEDEEISDISKEYGAEIIKRPHELARDDSSSVDVVLHALDYLEKIDNFPDFFILLQPTSPLRQKEDIENAIRLFRENECDALISTCLIDHSSMLAFKAESEYITPYSDVRFLNSRRQDMPELYHPNGAIYITTPEVIREKRTFYPKKTIQYVMPKNRSIDLDTPFDFELAEYFLK